MESTEKLYYKDQYIREFKAVIKSIVPGKGDTYDVVLDQTAFFPESGGQVADKGILAGGEVIDVSIEEDVITHSVRFADGKSPDKGQCVEGQIDFDFRFSNMQQHTGEHIFSGIVNKLFGYENVGFHLSENNVTMDYSGKLSEEDIARVEYLANKAIYNNIYVNAFFPNKAEIAKLEYRSKLDAEEMGQIRIVDIEGIDTCACCAPHVARTGEVGIIKVLSAMNYKSGTRIHILCGYRALEDYKNKHGMIQNLSHTFSAQAGDIEASVAKLQRELESKKEIIRDLENSSLESALENIDLTKPIVFVHISDMNLIRKKVNDLTGKCDGIICAFNGNDKEGYNYIFASKQGGARGFLENLKQHVEIKGGGQDTMVQGQVFATKQELLKLIG